MAWKRQTQFAYPNLGESFNAYALLLLLFVHYCVKRLCFCSFRVPNLFFPEFKPLWLQDTLPHHSDINLATSLMTLLCWGMIEYIPGSLYFLTLARQQSKVLGELIRWFLLLLFFLPAVNTEIIYGGEAQVIEWQELLLFFFFFFLLSLLTVYRQSCQNLPKSYSNPSQFGMVDP